MEDIVANVPKKRMKLSSSASDDLRRLSSPDLPSYDPPLIPQGRSSKAAAVVLDSVCGAVEVALRRVIPTSVYDSWTEDLQSTLLHLVEECSLGDGSKKAKGGRVFSLKGACSRLAVLQDREPTGILNYVFQLWKLEIVGVKDMVFDGAHDLSDRDFWEGKTWFVKLGLFNKISKAVLCKIPGSKTYCVSFPIEPSFLQFTRVLLLRDCRELEHLDLSEFPRLEVLDIKRCAQLKSVTGWEGASGLGFLSIWQCGAYRDFPNVQLLLSSREIWLVGRGSRSNDGIPWQPTELSRFSQCARLRTLGVEYNDSLSPVADLSSLQDLKFLEFLSLQGSKFSSIQGLSGLQALRTLELGGCRLLRRVPDLGCLKGLRRLNMSHSCIEDLEGVGELHLLTHLHLCFCLSLKRLPFLGHLKALVYLNLLMTPVKEIPGREGLISLKTLECNVELGAIEPHSIVFDS